MRDKMLFWIWLGGGLIGFATALLLGPLAATAQKAERGTQHWTIAIPTTFGLGDGNIHVFDTSGVCLYVLYGDKQGGIAAVPKTQLPANAGCQ
jgi:hypothetical protein